MIPRLYILLFALFLTNNIKGQNYIWANGLPGKLWASECKEMAVDDAGNILVTGFIEDSVDFDPGPGEYWLYGPDRSPYVAKYSAHGSFIWAKVFPCTFWGRGEDIAVDEAGNVYVLGHYSEEIEFQPDNLTPYPAAFLMKLSPDGTILWNNIFRRRYGLNATALTYRKGKLYIGGQLLYGVDLDPGSDSAIFYNDWVGLYFASYDTTGQYLWGKNINSSGNTSAIYDIETDTDNNIYMTGYFNEYSDFDPGPGVRNLTPSPPYMELFLAKYDSLGNFIWAEDIPVRTAYGTQEGPQLEITPSGHIILAGSFGGKVDFDPGPDSLLLESSPGTYSAFFGAFKENGEVKWVQSLYGSSSSATGLALDDDENIYITGDALGTNDFDPGPEIIRVTMDPIAGIYFAMYDSTGSYKWARTTGNWIGGTVTNPTIHQKGGYQYLCGYFRRKADLDPGPDSAYLRAQSVSGFFAKYSVTGASVISGCINDSIQMLISDTSFIDSIKWSFYGNSGRLEILRSYNGKYLFRESGDKEILLLVYKQGMEYQERFQIYIAPAPQVDLGEDRILCGGHKIHLQAENAEANYLWSDGSTKPSFTVEEPGLYWVEVSVGSCVEYDSVKVEPGDRDLVLPNIITPNGDGINDIFYPENGFGAGVFALEIYNRWGGQVFKSADYSGEWNASALSEGVYYYIMKPLHTECRSDLTGFVHIFK